MSDSSVANHVPTSLLTKISNLASGKDAAAPAEPPTTVPAAAPEVTTAAPPAPSPVIIDPDAEEQTKMKDDASAIVENILKDVTDLRTADDTEFIKPVSDQLAELQKNGLPADAEQACKDDFAKLDTSYKEGIAEYQKLSQEIPTSQTALRDAIAQKFVAALAEKDSHKKLDLLQEANSLFVNLYAKFDRLSRQEKRKAICDIIKTNFDNAFARRLKAESATEGGAGSLTYENSPIKRYEDESFKLESIVRHKHDALSQKEEDVYDKIKREAVDFSDVIDHWMARYHIEEPAAEPEPEKKQEQPVAPAPAPVAAPVAPMPAPAPVEATAPHEDKETLEKFIETQISKLNDLSQEQRDIIELEVEARVVQESSNLIKQMQTLMETTLHNHTKAYTDQIEALQQEITTLKDQTRRTVGELTERVDAVVVQTNVLATNVETLKNRVHHTSEKQIIAQE
jgi:hypothetical protein